MASKLPATYRKLVARCASTKFRDVVSIVTVSTPTPGEGEVLVKNKYVGINATDINTSAGRFRPKDFPTDLGFELVPNNAAVPLPDLKPEYLPIMVSGNAAAICIDKVCDLKAGETVLVTAAAGGQGQFAVQQAKLSGCHVIGTCSTEEKAKFLKDLGCDRPINYKKEDLKEVLKKEYPKGIDVVYETIGGEMFDTCIDNLASKGRLVVVGFTSGYESETGLAKNSSLTTLPRTGLTRSRYSGCGRVDKQGEMAAQRQLLVKSASVRGFALDTWSKEWGTYAEKQLSQLKEGKLKACVDKGDNSPTGPFVGLDKVVDAVDYLYSRKSIGKVIVEIK